MDWDELLKKIRGQRAALETELDGLLAKDEPTAEEVARAEAIETGNIPEIDKRIALTERRAKEYKALDESRGVRAGHDDAGFRAGNGKIEVGKALIEEDPKRGFPTIRHFLLDVMREARGLRPANKDGLRLLSLERIEAQRTAGSDEQGVYDDAAGGFLVPEGYSPELLSVAAESDPLAGLTTNIPMQSPVVNLPARTDKDHSSSVTGGLTVGRNAETVAATASRMTVEKVSMHVHDMYGLAYATENLITDSPISIIAILQAGFRDEFGAAILEERLNGTGVGQFLGIMASPALVTVAKETGQTADTIVYQNVVKMRSRCWGYGAAVWLANHDTFPQLAQMSLSVGTGGSAVWFVNAQEDAPAMLLGRPIHFTERCATVGDLGDIVLVNPTQYLEGTYQPLQTAESIHVRFTNHERAFKFWLRNAGAPWWRSALTPKRGSTLSPFVTLAARA